MTGGGVGVVTHGTPERKFLQNFRANRADFLQERETAGADASPAEVAVDAGAGVGVVARVAPLLLRSE
jgi:hypothetical protein